MPIAQLTVFCSVLAEGRGQGGIEAMTRIAVIALALALAGCASKPRRPEPPHWLRDGPPITEKQFNNDKYDCLLEAGGDTQPPVFFACMKRRGYTWSEKVK
jgi:hypothetical protein